jgi:hypothetical protein
LISVVAVLSRLTTIRYTLSADESPRGTNDTPHAAELGHVLAEDLARLPIADVVVERSSCVRDLKRAVRSARRAEEASGRATAGARSRFDDIRRPRPSTRTAARAPLTWITSEAVENETAAVEEDAPYDDVFTTTAGRDA